MIPRRQRVTAWTGLLIAAVFALIVMPILTVDRWIVASGTGRVIAGKPAAVTVRVPPFVGFETKSGRVGGGGGIVIARGDPATASDEQAVNDINDAMPHGPVPDLAYLLLVGVLAGIFAHHTRRSNRGRLLRVQLVSLAMIAITALIVKVLMLATALSVLVVPVALFAMLPTLVLDRIVGLATGTLAALVFSMLVPFDVGVAILLLVQAGTAGLVVAERPKHGLRSVLATGAITTLFTGATYLLLQYLTNGHLPAAGDPIHSPWLAAVLGPAIATVLAVPLIPVYQLLVAEITQRKLVELEDLSQPLLRQIAGKAPGSWQHSLMMANMAEIAANAIGANGRLVRVGAYFHDLGKSLQPKYFIENLEPGETSPHDRLPPEVSCDAIFAHVTEGIVTARRAGLHERIIDFMHMHHGNGVLEYFWAKCQEQGNPKQLTVEDFRYPGVPPQSRETAILAICDAVEAASRTLKQPDPKSIDSLVQRIIYGKLHLGQLDESGLSMSDLRRVSDSLRETIRHANHGRIEYPWQKAHHDASHSGELPAQTTTAPRLDSLDRPARPDTVQASQLVRDDALATTGGISTPKLRVGAKGASTDLGIEATAPVLREDQPQREQAAPRQAPSRLRDDAAAAEVSESAKSIPMYVRETGSGGAAIAPRPSPEARRFASDAVDALNETSKDMPAALRDAAEPAAARKRAATLPPTPPRRSPTMPPLIRPLTQPVERMRSPSDPPLSQIPLFASSNPSPLPLLAPPNVKPTRPPPDDQKTTIPPPIRREALLVEDEPAKSSRRTMERVAQIDETSTTQPRMLKVDDASATQPRLSAAAVGDATSPNVELPPVGKPSHTIPHQPPAKLPANLPDSPWSHDLAARIDAAIEDDFGGETPVIAPTNAEIQALLGAAPDPTRKQSFEEIERLHRVQQQHARPSDPILEIRRGPHQTTEVDPDDIESAIELAPPARRNTIGVAKKKPTE